MELRGVFGAESASLTLVTLHVCSQVHRATSPTLCLAPPAVIDRIPEIPEKAPVRELDCTTARDRRCFLRRELQQNRAEWTSRTFLEQPFKPRPLLVWRQANHRSLPTYYWRCDDISWCSNNNIKGNDNCVLMTYYAACSKLLLNPRLENMDTNVQNTLSTPQKKSKKLL